MTKVINAGVLLLAFSEVIRQALRGKQGVEDLVRAATFDMAGKGSTGKFDLGKGMTVYGPMIAALVLKKVISMVRKNARF